MFKFAFLVCTIAALAYRYYGLLDIDKKLVEPKGQTCHLLGKDTAGSVEDLVTYKKGMLIGGSGDTIAAARESPEKARPGYFVLVDVRSGKPVLKKLKVTGTPKVFRLQPHGLFYSEKTKRLYAVNHGGVSGIGTRVEMFNVREGADGLPELEWVMPIGGGHLFPNIALNSVVEGNDNEIYASIWQNAPIPDAGEHHPRTITDYLGRALQRIVEIGAVAGFTSVQRCVFDVASKSTIQCKAVASGFAVANGITMNKNRDVLYVNDVVLKRIYVYSVNKKTGQLTQAKDQTIILPHAVDNIHMDHETGEIWMGSIALIFEQFDTKAKKAGTFVAYNPKNNKLTDEIVHDGSVLSQLATCMW
eukprot:CAMPEP_0203745218 /NCGR_PEP_ID=MMETSP0098-20131031/1039_1 /ASSEMBLY_ACC=CAM_ASM_000208 /TAXON_ID=96639 /ORGANISM=" , Strain NY0313808BC1" /LENGTH=359 /DNA_ID=CAMNT_0050632951 /DNA_START=209 /DNA_END=1285 /DNA_ORIENTATION=+